MLWANAAGGKLLGAASFPALSARRWPEAHALRRTIASLARALPEQGTLARLRLTDSLAALPTACRCRPIRADSERGVLVVGLEGAAAPPPVGALATFLSGSGAIAVLYDADGTVLAEGAPGICEKVTASTPHVVFAEGDRAFRLALVEQPTAGTAGDGFATPSFDDPALSVVGRGTAETVAARAEETRAEPSPQPGEQPSPSPQPVRDARPTPPAKERRQAPRVRRQPVEASQPAKAEKPESEAPEPGEGPARSVMAGRVPRELSRKPVRFLWQTDAADRTLFVSPGLAQVVGRNAEIVGERWHEASARLRLDPTGRIARALRERDTWSGLTAWWPIEGSNVRVPVELTALPVFGADHSFQGYRGFGVLRPAEALMPAAFEARFGDAEAEQLPPYEEAVGTDAAKVVPIRADVELRPDHPELSEDERNAFEEIAAELRNRVTGGYSRREEVTTEDTAPGEAPDDEFEPADELESEDRAEPPARELPPPPAPSASTPPAPSASTPPEIVLRGPPAPRGAAPGVQPAEMQRRLREMTAILDTATDGVVILDAEGTIESVNASAEALFGLEANEMQGRAFSALLTPASRKSALDYLSSLKDGGVASLLNEGREVEATAGPGTIPLFMTIGRLSSAEGGRFCAVLRDITHWKRIEAELTAAKRAAEEASGQKSEFLARVSHEVRTPLNTIIGFAEVMIEERFGPIENERYREYLRDIRTSGEHVVSLVNDLLDISKIEAGKLDLHFSAVPLNQLVDESIGSMQPQANRARVVLRSSLSREVPAIVADERTMRQIVLNLLSNSVKFTHPGGQVIVSTSLSESGEAILRIRDTGEGMSEEELARALEPFRQLTTAALADRTGTGLGLPLTKALVEANRASLTIRSARGEGTVVSVTIPPTRVLSE